MAFWTGRTPRLLLAVGFLLGGSVLAAGCLDSEVKLTVPAPRIGDYVEYENYAQNHERVSLHVVGVEQIRSVTGASTEAIRVDMTGSTGDDPYSYTRYVDVDGNYMIRSEENCGDANAPCVEAKEVRFTRAGGPWAWGSSLFQGRTWQEAGSAKLSLTVAGSSINVTSTSSRAERAGDDTGLRIQLASDAQPSNILGDFHAYEGEFLVTAASPYVEHAKGHYRYLTMEYPPYEASFDYRKVAERRGTTEIPGWAPSSSLVPQRCEDAEATVVGGRPPGIDQAISEFNASFAEALEYLAQTDETYQANQGAGHFHIEFLQMNNHTSSTTLLGSTRSIEVQARYMTSQDATKRVSVIKEDKAPDLMNEYPKFSHDPKEAGHTFLPAINTASIHVVPFFEVYENGKGVVDRSFVMPTIRLLENGFSPADARFATYYRYGLFFQIPDSNGQVGTLSAPLYWDSRTGCLMEAYLVPTEDPDDLLGRT